MIWIGESFYDKENTMPMKQGGKQVYKTLQGKLIDMDMLRQKNELTPAVGNVRVNARGDELGRGGKIVRSREEVLKDYYAAQEGMPDENVRKHEAEIVEESKPAAKPKRTKKEEQPDPLVVTPPTAAEEAEWVEDEDGDFVKKETKSK